MSNENFLSGSSIIDDLMLSVSGSILHQDIDIQNYYMYKKFGVIPEMEYEMEEVKEIEQYIKEQEEAEQ